MGQLITGGRLEVTALGDAVNECARIQEAAAGGQVLASKNVLETLGEQDAHALSIEPGRVLYIPLGELPDVSEKVKRDAGGIPVAGLT
jgi:class 3 adenylate cyclase